MVLKTTLESPLDCKGIQPVHPKGDRSWVFFRRTDFEAETPILGYLLQRAESFEKTLMLGKIGGRRRRGQQRMRWLDGITEVVFRLGGWSPRLPTGLHVSRGTLDPARFTSFSLTWLSHSVAGLPIPFN